MQPQFCALMTQATGPSVISEALYENRFRHVEFLQQMGARIAIDGRSAVINGPARLHGTRMSIPDIRSGAALVIAGLCAEGTTELDKRLPPRARVRRPRESSSPGSAPTSSGSPPTSPEPRCATSPAWSATEDPRTSAGQEGRHRPRHDDDEDHRQGRGHDRQRADRGRDPRRRHAGGDLRRRGILEAAADDAEFQLRRPIAGGEIVDATSARWLVNHAMIRAAGRQRIFKPDVVIAVMSTPARWAASRSLLEAAALAGARTAYLLDAPLAAAMGAGHPPERAQRTSRRRHRRRQDRRRRPGARGHGQRPLPCRPWRRCACTLASTTTSARRTA